MGQHLGELENHEAPEDVHAAWEEEGPSPCAEGVCVLGNAISQVRHDNLCETTTCRAALRSKTHWSVHCKTSFSQSVNPSQQMQHKILVGPCLERKEMPLWCY